MKKIILLGLLTVIVLVGTLAIFTDRKAKPFVYKDLVILESPLPEAQVQSPLVIKGKARGNWFFEASFPIILTDWDGRIIAQGIAQASENWMTTDFVPFEATLEFQKPEFIGDFSKRGFLILKKDNPSGLPEHDDALEITLFFGDITGSPTTPVACTMEAKICPDGSAVGRVGPNCEFALCPGEDNQGSDDKETLCQPKQRNADFCTADYAPVCAKVEIQCIKAPCDPIKQTFSNACEACKNSLVKSYISGECKN
ncbi:MAG TPA: Gmad2 immunoglobulin-like domain-containing protein [Candidatus Paceibacterota bacterium]